MEPATTWLGVRQTDPYTNEEHNIYSREKKGKHTEKLILPERTWFDGKDAVLKMEESRESSDNIRAKLLSVTVNCSVQILLFSKNLNIKIYKIIILVDVLYGCEAWSITLREERRLWVFKNRILMQILGPMRDENRGLKRPHNKELFSLYRPPNIIRVIKSRRLRLAGHVAKK